MITDSGAELLLAAIYQQARADVEEAFARVVKLRQACEHGRLPRFLQENVWPLAGEDERSAVWWCTREAGWPKEMAAMLAALAQYERHCRACCLTAGRAGDGRVV